MERRAGERKRGADDSVAWTRFGYERNQKTALNYAAGLSAPLIIQKMCYTMICIVIWI